MIHNKEFREWAIANGYDVSFNENSNYYNSSATRIAYYQQVGISAAKPV